MNQQNTKHNTNHENNSPNSSIVPKKQRKEEDTNNPSTNINIDESNDEPEVIVFATRMVSGQGKAETKYKRGESPTLETDYQNEITASKNHQIIQQLKLFELQKELDNIKKHQESLENKLKNHTDLIEILSSKLFNLHSGDSNVINNYYVREYKNDQNVHIKNFSNQLSNEILEKYNTDKSLNECRTLFVEKELEMRPLQEEMAELSARIADLTKYLIDG